MILRIVRRVQHFFIVVIVRDKRSVPAAFLVPVGLILLMGWVMRTENNQVTIAVVTEGNGWAVSDIATRVETSFHDDDIATFRAVDVEAAQRGLRDGKAQGYIVVDSALAGAVFNGDPHKVRIGVRDDEVSVSQDVRAAIGRAVAVVPLQLVREASGADPITGDGPVTFDSEYVYGGGHYDTLDTLMPALMGFVIFLTIFTNALVSIGNDRGLHTLDRILSTPLKRWEFVVGTVFGFTIIALIQTAMILVAAALVLHTDHAGSVLAIFGITAVVAMSGVALAIFLSAFTRSEAEAMQMVPAVLLPQFIICGVLFPIAAMPEVLQQVARVLPVTYAVDALRDVMIRGESLTAPSVITSVTVLLMFTALFLVLGTRALQPQEE